MTLLSSFDEPVRIAVVGATGGIGAALLSHLEEDPRAGEIFAFARRPESICESAAQCARLDFADETSIADAALLASANGPIDLVIVATGLLHQGDRIRPEKSLRELDPQALADVFAANATGPAIVAKHFLPRLARQRKTVFVALSARVGSIGDNRLGGWASYRASKAALNMLFRTLAIEHARRFPESIVATLHPGTVDTKLSAPYTGRVAAGRLFDPSVSAGHLLKVIDGLGPGQSGGFFAWDGTAIDY